MAIDEKLIARINELAHKKKTVGLNKSEQEEQQCLRQQYLKEFRKGFEQQLQSVKIVDPEGNDVTPSKLKKRQSKDVH